MTIKKAAKDTLTPFELNFGESLEFTKINGEIVTIKLLKTAWEVLFTDMESLSKPIDGAKTIYQFSADIEINGEPLTLTREIPTQKSFYEPWEFCGIRLWFDAISATFIAHGGFLKEKDKAGNFYSKPNKDARFAVQDATLSIAPARLYPWCPLPKGGLKIEDCYRGEDCWMGPYNGMAAHGGLDINHPCGTPLWAPFDLDDHYYFNSVKMGDNNNRWRGVRTWDNGARWSIGAYHMTELTAPEHAPVKAGEQFAVAAGVWCGVADHTHFVFKIEEDGEEYWLDPWILFWQMYRDAE